MQIRMGTNSGLSLAEIEGFIEASDGVEFQSQERVEMYGWVEATLVNWEYHLQGKKQKGTIRSYLRKITGLSMSQVTRLIRLHRKSGYVKTSRKPRRRFPSKYTAADFALLAKVDEAHQRLSGPATKCILKREWKVFGKGEYQRLAGISVSHLYNMRSSERYRKQAIYLAPTRAVQISIGERRCPDPRGRPGYLRVDTVHQGDQDGRKGVYHINAVATVTQWEVVGCAAKISEQYLIAGVPHAGERAGGGQEWGGSSQAHGIPAYRRRARRSHSEVLHGALQSVSELSSPVRFRDGEGQRERKTETDVPERRLRHAVREAETGSAGGAISEGGHYLGETGSHGRPVQRHRICTKDHESQERVTAEMPRPGGSAAVTAVNSSRSPKRAEEMAGLWKEWKAKRRLPPFPRVPWESRKQREIPTCPQLSLRLPGFKTKRRQAEELEVWAMGKWKSKSRISTFPPPRQPAAAGQKIIFKKLASYGCSSLLASGLNRKETFIPEKYFAPQFRSIFGLETAL